MKRAKQALALLLSLVLMLGLFGLAEEPVEAAEEVIEEVVEEAPAEEAEAPADEELPEEEAPVEEEPAEEEPVEEPVEQIGDESFELNAFNDDEGFEIEGGVLTGYTGKSNNITIPSGVTSIASKALYYDGNLRSVHIPSSVTYIGDQAFDMCSNLASVYIEDGPLDVGTSVFADCQKMTTVHLGEGLTRIGDSMFDGCRKLSSVDIPNSVTSIGDRAFATCPLTSIEIPGSVKSIGDHAFYWCQTLQSVTFSSEGLEIIDNSAFDNCNVLDNIKLPSTLKTIGDNAFYDCWALSTLDIPDGVTSIGDFAFGYCKALASIKIPGSVKTLGGRVFAHDTNLLTVNIPEGVTSIGTNAFLGFTEQQSVYLPKSLTEIDPAAFGETWEPFTATVYVYKNSAAHKFCKEHSNIKNVKLRDGTEDATVSLPVGSILLSQKESQTIKPTTEGLKKKEKYSFSSSDKSVATVSSKGKITAQGVGTAVITAKGKTSKQSASCTVTVISAPQTVRIEKPTKVDYTTDDPAFALAASVEPADAVQSVKWSSSDETVARVSAEGQVTLVGQGKATITAKSEKKGTNGKQRSDTFALTVEDLHMPANVKIVEKASGPVYVDKDKPLTLHYAMDPVKEGQEPVSAVTWSIPKSKERKIATINSETGEITPLKEGSATVKITTQKKGGTGSKPKQLTDTVKITVVDPTKPRSVMINEGEKEIPLYYEAGKTLELKSTIEPATATPGVKWSISSKAQRKIATVDATTGVVTPTGNKFGVVTVKVETTAKKSNKKAATATIKIAVVDPKYPYSVKITREDGSEFQDGVELKVGQTLKLSAAIEPTTATEKTGITWSISKSQTKYATVDQDGTVHGVKAGKTVTITAKTENGKKATIKIKIVQ